MKLLLVVGILLSANLGFSKVFNDKDKNEAYANIMGLYVEELEKEALDTSLTGQEQYDLKKNMLIAKKQIDKTEVRKSRMFLVMDFEVMCKSLDLKVDANNEKIKKAHKTLKRRAPRRNSPKYRHYHRQKQSDSRARSLNNTISEIQNKFCQN